MSFMDNFRAGSNGNLLSLNTSHPSDNYDGGLMNFANQVLQLHKDKINRENNINDVLLQHQVMPINKFAPPYTTNNNISYGITPANTQIDTKLGTSGQLNPLDLAKLKQGEEKLSDARNKNNNDLGFKYSKESTDSNIRQQRADIYDYKTKHPDHKFDFSGPTVRVMNPTDGSVYDTGMETGKLSMEDKMNLSARNDVMRDSNRLNITNENNINRDNNRSTNNLTEISARGNETRKTNEAKPNSKSTSNSQINQGHINSATQLLNEHPEYAPYIKLGKSDNGKVNGFTVVAPNGPDDPLYHDINSKIYNTGMGDVNIPSDKSTDNTNKNPSYSSSTTKLYTDKSGQKYNIPMDKINEFLKDNPDAIEVK